MLIADILGNDEFDASCSCCQKLKRQLKALLKKKTRGAATRARNERLEEKAEKVRKAAASDRGRAAAFVAKMKKYLKLQQRDPDYATFYMDGDKVIVTVTTADNNPIDVNKRRLQVLECLKEEYGGRSTIERAGLMKYINKLTVRVKT